MPERKPYIAYSDDLSEFAIFDWEIGALKYAVKHRWNVRPLRFEVPLRAQLASTVVGPADGDVVDAEIDYSEAYTELAEMRLAVLAIHKQAEWGACCDWCHYDDRDVPWPCPTAQALGVTADA
jgi:hypothetical protein